jgi:hypothetical protein
MPGVKDVSLELIELVSLALTACRSCKAFCSFDFTLEQSNDETLGGFFAIGKLGNPAVGLVWILGGSFWWCLLCCYL